MPFSLPSRVTAMSERLTIDGYDYHVPPNVRVEVERLKAENERLRSRLRVIRRAVESERGRNLDADRVIDRVVAWVDEALEGNDHE